jgi:hypothetical protein
MKAGEDGAQISFQEDTHIAQSGKVQTGGAEERIWGSGSIRGTGREPRVEASSSRLVQ